jgi:hypothetical protein
MNDSQECYVLDANVFIQAKRRFYPFDVVPGYWDGLCWHQKNGRVCSIDKVRQELENGGDELWTWARDTFGLDGFVDSAGCAGEFGRMATWVQQQAQFTMEARAEFMSVADGWLAAQALHSRKVLVTLEEEQPQAKRKVPLPNVCKAFGIQTITPFEMLRRLGVQLGWKAPKINLSDV